jgi:hypothetical protein
MLDTWSTGRVCLLISTSIYVVTSQRASDFLVSFLDGRGKNIVREMQVDGCIRPQLCLFLSVGCREIRASYA